MMQKEALDCLAGTSERHVLQPIGGRASAQWGRSDSIAHCADGESKRWELSLDLLPHAEPFSSLKTCYLLSVTARNGTR
jgi:hypothetical protein